MDKRQIMEELTDIVDNMYLRGRMMSAREKTPRYYGSDILLFPNEVYTLKAIAQHEGINQTELSEQMFRTKGATSSVVQKLKQKGLVIQREDPVDSRFTQLYPTEKGREVYHNLVRYDREYLDSIARRLDVSMEELVQFNRILRIMNQDFIHRYQQFGSAAFAEKMEE